MVFDALDETADFYRIDASPKLDAERRALLGQYMTPAPVARFMASLFSKTEGDVRVLDPGAGVGALTAAFGERLCAEEPRPRAVDFVCYEIDRVLSDYLGDTLMQTEARCRAARVTATGRLVKDDFILDHPLASQWDLFDRIVGEDAGFTHAILNPPYKKISAGSEHRTALRAAGVETSNLYTGFMFVAASRLRDGGEMVAIVPRSFCNGPYFKDFRKRFFAMMRLVHIHVFEKRNHAFKDDDVLQENIVVHAVKDQRAGDVAITTSSGAAFEVDAAGSCVAEDMTYRTVSHDSVMRPDDPDLFIHIAANEIEQGIVDRMNHFRATLAEIGVEISTGPVVDFRLKDDLLDQPREDACPAVSHSLQGRCSHVADDEAQAERHSPVRQQSEVALGKQGHLRRHTKVHVQGGAAPDRRFGLRDRAAGRSCRIREPSQRLSFRADGNVA